MRHDSSDRGTGRAARSRAAAVGLLLLLAATISACATLGRAVFEEPVVRFHGMRINGLGLSGGSLDLQLAVYNPNRFDLETTRFSYNLLMDEVRIAEGVLDSRQTFQSGDTSVVTIPINFTYAGLGRAGQELIRSGTINYRVRGDLTVATPLGNFTRPYDQTGRYTPLRGASSR